jgi:hypothetical protein
VKLILFSLFSYFIFFQFFSQQPIFVTDGNSNLYSVNLFNCSSKLIGLTRGFYDIAFSRDGKLWGIDGDLYLVDTLTGAATLIGESIGTHSVSLVGLNDSILLSEVNDSLYGINVRSAQSYNIGFIGYSSCGDLSWYNNNLYMSSNRGQLIKIVLNNTFTQIISATALNNISDACFLGLITTQYNETQNLIGFTGQGNVDNISAIDGTYELICSTLNTSSVVIEGGASMSFPSSLPVSLLNFTYSIINQTVKLQWQTTNEINSDYFSIERSSDGLNFSGIGKVNAAGNSNGLKQYAFIDHSPLSQGRGVGVRNIIA